MIRAEPSNLAEEKFGWLVGRSIDEVRFAEPSSWWIQFAGGGTLAMHGGVWRLIKSGSMVACSQDRGHRFGLPEPFDAVGTARTALRNARIEGARIREGAPDLELCFSGGLVLEALALSRGYESWEIRDPTGRCLVVHGSRDASTWHDQPPADDRCAPENVRPERRLPFAERRTAKDERIGLDSRSNHGIMPPTTTITLDATLKARLADLARQAGQDVDEFVEALLRRVAEADVRFERGVPVFPRRPGAPILKVEDVDRLVDGPDA